MSPALHDHFILKKIMDKCPMSFLAFVCLLFSVTLPLTLGEEGFSYEKGSPSGPERWGDLRAEWSTCKNGQTQSPIDISHPTTTAVQQVALLTNTYQPADARLTVDHDVAVEWPNGAAGSITIDNGISYPINNVHWHTPAEHTINSIRLDLEIHMLHKNADRITVIAHLYKLGEPDPFLARLIDNIASLDPTTNPSIDIGKMNPSEVISKAHMYYRYTGSISTPPCSESVTWLVDQTIRSASPEQVQTLHGAIGDNGVGNARPVQPLNNRKIESGPLVS